MKKYVGRVIYKTYDIFGIRNFFCKIKVIAVMYKYRYGFPVCWLNQSTDVGSSVGMWVVLKTNVYRKGLHP